MTIIFVLFMLPQVCSSRSDPGSGYFFQADIKTWLGVIGGLVVLVVVGYIAFYFKQILEWIRGPQPNQQVPEIPMQQVPEVPMQLVPDIGSSVPMQPFLEFRGNIEMPEEMDCAICLAYFTDEDMVRALPGCGHAFHVEYIDGWLAGNPSCPLCRENVQL